MINAIQVLRMYLRELERVHELADNFIQKQNVHSAYLNTIKKSPNEFGLKATYKKT